MDDAPRDILCIGSVHWDVIGRSPTAMYAGSDVPGRITRQPGGVAMNIATSLSALGLRPILLTAVGRDAAGRALIDHCRRAGVVTRHIYRSRDLPTDSYVAIEDANGLIAAIADVHSLEKACDRILGPLTDGRLGSAGRPWTGPAALDGNLTAGLLDEIAKGPLLAAADLRIAPASSAKAVRLRPLLEVQRATLYLNLDEARVVADAPFGTAAEAAAALAGRGTARVIVTDGARPAADATADGVVTAAPPVVRVSRVTGAGDTFMAAHIAAEYAGAPRDTALGHALQAAAAHVSEDRPW